MPLSWFKKFTKSSSETAVASAVDALSETVAVSAPALAPTPVREEWLEPPRPPQPATIEIPTEKIAQRAYEKWVNRGCTPGSSDQDWLEAEAELRAEFARHSAEHLPHRSR